jgi:hypothetical protein
MAARSCAIVGSSFLAAVCVCAACLAIWGPSAHHDQAVLLLPESWPRSLPGAEGGGTSWIAGRHVLPADVHTQPRMITCGCCVSTGMHREPMWTQAATGACGNDEPCPLGRADQGHFFQRDDNPWVDKREVLPLVACNFVPPHFSRMGIRRCLTRRTLTTQKLHTSFRGIQQKTHRNFTSSSHIIGSIARMAS